MHKIAAAAQPRQRWKNAGGWTTELARSGPAEGFRWRVSVADIETDGPFSSFPGVQRELLLLAGAGLRLDIEGRAPVTLRERFARLRFAGTAAVDCRLLDGPVRALNLMLDEIGVEGQLLLRPLVDAMVLFREPGAEWFIHVLEGCAKAQAGDETLCLDAGDSLVLDWRRQPAARVVVRGGAQLAMVKVTTASLGQAPD